MPDYSKGKIYKILNTIDGEIYVGSTCQPLSKRFYEHKRDHKREKFSRLLIYDHMLNHGEEHFYIELLENCPCHSREELRAKEGEWIRK
jgi:group I intron endonuclease